MRKENCIALAGQLSPCSNLIAALKFSSKAKNSHHKNAASFQHFGLTYSSINNSYTRNAEITPNYPIVSHSGSYSSYRITDPDTGLLLDLPAGLVMDASGEITGTPAVDQAATNYAVTGNNIYGDSNEVVISIEVSLSPPAGLTYGTTNCVYYAGDLITPNSPTVTNPVDNYSISPSLPSGLDINADTGVISGSPSAPAASAEYTVTAANSAGSDSCVIIIVVYPPDPPAGLSYDVADATYYAGEPTDDNNPTLTSGWADSWSCTPALPDGLTLNPSTGVISGTPVEGKGFSPRYDDNSDVIFTITALNSYGSTTCTIRIQVQTHIFNYTKAPENVCNDYIPEGEIVEHILEEPVCYGWVWGNGKYNQASFTNEVSYSFLTEEACTAEDGPYSGGASDPKGVWYLDASEVPNYSSGAFLKVCKAPYYGEYQ